MSVTLHEILHYETLTGIVNDPRGGLPTDGIPAGFFNLTRNVPGDSMSWLEVAGTRQTAMAAHRASASQRREMKGLTKRQATALFIHEHLFHDVDVLNRLRAFDNPTLQAMGRQEIARQAAFTRQLLDNTRLAAIASVLLAGKLRYLVGASGTGGLYDPAGATGTEIDFGVPAGNRTQLDILGDGSIIGASWATATTNIPAHVTDVVVQMLKKSGYRITTAIYGKNILGYLTQNNYTKELINGNPAFSQAFGMNSVPGGFLNLNWVNGSMLFFEEPDGTLVKLVGDDTVVFLPDPSPEWWEILQGTYEVPTSLNVVPGTAEQAINQFATVAGRFNYATISTDPSGIKHNYGDTFLPTLKVPNAVAIADVTP